MGFDPQLVTQEAVRSVPLPPRFAIEEQHGAATRKKIRLIDDFKRSEVNSLLKLHDASVPNTHWAPCSQWPERSRYLGLMSH